MSILKIKIIRKIIIFFIGKPQKNNSINVFGLNFKNQLGLAAGFDKNAKYIDVLADMGFGFVEIGTVTPLAQEGNPKPRLFRLKKDHALIIRMGFNNDGVDEVIKNLKQKKSNIIVGGNIGKNKNTTNENAHKDYLICFQKLYDYVDYFVLNVSSPNTPNLRQLQDKEPLLLLIKTILDARIEQNKTKKYKPILLKIAPDLNQSQLDEIIEILNTTELDGLIATNTTIERTNLKTSKKILDHIGAGGLSGQPLTDKATEIISYISKNTSKPIIGVGGIYNFKTAIQKLNAGASLIQVYTGYIYKGNALIKEIIDGINK